MHKFKLLHLDKVNTEENVEQRGTLMSEKTALAEFVADNRHKIGKSQFVYASNCGISKETLSKINVVKQILPWKCCRALPRTPALQLPKYLL